MKTTVLWKSFVTAFGLITLGIALHAGVKVMQYRRLSTQAPALWKEFESVELGRDAYTLQARYAFATSDGILEGESRLQNLRARCRAGIDVMCNRAQSREWIVWYCPDHPEISSLEHAFPWRSSVYAALLLVSFGYIFTMSFVARKLG